MLLVILTLDVAKIAKLARAAGRQVHVWTLRMENPFLPGQYQRGDDPEGRGDFAGYVRAMVRTGVDGLFSDFPAQARAAMTPAP